jgi:hypothetical protein
MIDEILYEGLWFLPDQPQVAVPGSVSFSPNDGVSLKLNGSLTPELFRPDNRPPIILGDTSDGKRITLVSCLVSGASISAPGYAVERYRAQMMLIGCHISDRQSLRFREFRIRFWNLEECIGEDAVVTNWHKFQAPMMVTAQFPKQLRVNVEGTEVVTDHVIHPFGHRFVEQGFRQKAYFTLVTPEPMSVQEILGGRGIGRSLHTLLEFAADSRLPVTELFVREFTNPPLPSSEEELVDEGSPEPVQVLMSQGDVLPPPSRRLPSDMIFNISLLEASWEECLRRWHLARIRFGPTFDHFFSLPRITGLPAEHRFLNLAQALESYHRRSHPNATREPEAEFASRLKRILDLLPNEDDQKWLSGELTYSNEVKLRTRLKQMYDLMPHAVQQRLGSRKDFAKRVTDTRNYMTHFNPDLAKSAVTAPKELWRLGDQLALVLRIAFLMVLDLDLDEALRSNWGQRQLARLDVLSGREL